MAAAVSGGEASATPIRVAIVDDHPAGRSQIVSAFRDKYEVLTGSDLPDAYRLLDRALGGGAQSRDELLRALATARVDDAVATGTGFTSTRGPELPGRIETLDGESFVPVP